MSQPYIGEIMLFAGSYAPQNFALCQGQLLSIATNQALFSILGTIYGGDGVNTFGLPDLRSRVPIGAGQGRGLSNYAQGEMTGEEQMYLLLSNMPAHTHLATVTGSEGSSSSSIGAAAIPADQISPVGNVPAIPTFGRTQIPAYTSPSNETGTLAGTTNSTAGNIRVTNTLSGESLPFSILPPILAINFCIALAGVYPSRS